MTPTDAPVNAITPTDALAVVLEVRSHEELLELRRSVIFKRLFCLEPLPDNYNQDGVRLTIGLMSPGMHWILVMELFDSQEEGVDNLTHTQTVFHAHRRHAPWGSPLPQILDVMRHTKRKTPRVRSGCTLARLRSRASFSNEIFFRR